MSGISGMIAHDESLVDADRDATEKLLWQLKRYHGDDGRPDIPPQLLSTLHGTGRPPWRPRVTG
jgi:hypothetical protein